MLVLALDTSTPLITVTLATVNPGPIVTPLAHAEFDNAFAHAEQLMPLTQATLARAGRRLPELDAVVVGVGPGPFTGLRVGISTAAALGDGLGVPVYPVPSHQGLAAAARSAATARSAAARRVEVEGAGHEPAVATYLVVTDARRKEVFVTAFEGLHPVFGPTAVSPAALTKSLAANDLRVEYLVGAGANLVIDYLAMPVRELVTDLGLGLIESAAPEILSSRTPAPLTPLYLRRPDAVEPSKTRKSVLGRRQF